MSKQLFYFGCMDDVGHYYYPNRPSNMPGVNMNVFKVIDGTFTPGFSTKQGAAQEVIIGPLIIFAWHDYTIDSRPCSNSALIGYGYNNIDDMIKDAQVKFPSVMKRQPNPFFQKP